MSYSEYLNVDPTEYALQTSMPQPTFQSQQTPTQSQPKPQTQPQTQPQSNSSSPNINSLKQQGFFSSLKSFLNVQTGTVLVYAICFCIGGAFKDFVQNMISNLIQPLIVKLLLFTNIYNFSVVSDIINEKDNILNITTTVSQLVSFIILLLTVYLLYILINTVQ